MKLPTKVIIYVCDYDTDGRPIFAAVTNKNDIPEDQDGCRIGEYNLLRERMFKVVRELN